MPIFVGGVEVNAGELFIGGVQVQAVFVGNVQIFPGIGVLDPDRVVQSGDSRHTQFDDLRVLQFFVPGSEVTILTPSDVLEGENLDFTVVLSQTVAQDILVEFETGNVSDTATEGEDYVIDPIHSTRGTQTNDNRTTQSGDDRSLQFG